MAARPGVRARRRGRRSELGAAAGARREGESALHWAAPVALAASPLPLVVATVWSDIPLTRSLAAAALIMAASVLTPVKPVDGGAHRRGGRDGRRPHRGRARRPAGGRARLRRGAPRRRAHRSGGRDGRCGRRGGAGRAPVAGAGLARPRRADRRHLPRGARVVHRARDVVGRLQPAAAPDRRRHDRVGARPVDGAAAPGGADLVLGADRVAAGRAHARSRRGAEFPELLWWTFFITHSGAVVAALVLVVGRGIVPRPGAVWRAFGATVAVAAAAAAANLLTGGNYMWLREKPDEGSLLDFMGPWPWYIVSAAVLGLVLFSLLAALAARVRPGPRTGGPRRPRDGRARRPGRRRTRRSPPSPRP